MLRRTSLFFALLVLPLVGCKSLLPTPPSLTMTALVGQTDSARLFWTNTGTNNITVDLIDLNGDASFSLAGAQVTPGQIGPGGVTPLVSVVFAPTAEGTFRATAIPSSLTGQ